jgi:hypothetical protein
VTSTEKRRRPERDARPHGSIGVGFPRTENELAHGITNEALSPFAGAAVDHHVAAF